MPFLERVMMGRVGRGFPNKNQDPQRSKAMKPKIILGIDPGTDKAGWAILAGAGWIQEIAGNCEVHQAIQSMTKKGRGESGHSLQAQRIQEGLVPAEKDRAPQRVSWNAREVLAREDDLNIRTDLWKKQR